MVSQLIFFKFCTTDRTQPGWYVKILAPSFSSSETLEAAGFRVRPVSELMLLLRKRQKLLANFVRKHQNISSAIVSHLRKLLLSEKELRDEEPSLAVHCSDADIAGRGRHDAESVVYGQGR